jgi:hypothetical protein
MATLNATPQEATAARPPSEANPTVPKAVLNKSQRKGDPLHRPFRPSPLSGKSPSRANSAEEARADGAFFPPAGKSEDEAASDPTSPSQSQNEGFTTPPGPDGIKSSSDESSGSKALRSPGPGAFKLSADESEEDGKARQPSSGQVQFGSMRLSSEESEEEKKQSKSESEDGYDDEISRLNRMLDARMNELAGVEKKLLDTESKAARLLEVISNQMGTTFAEQLQEAHELRMQVFSHLEEMDGLLARTTRARDHAVDQQTREMVERHVNEVELILQHIESLAKDVEKRQPSVCMSMIRNILWWLRVLAFSFLVFSLCIFILLDEEDVRRLFSWSLNLIWAFINFTLKQKETLASDYKDSSLT